MILSCRYFKFVLGKLIAHIYKVYQVRTASIGNISGQMLLSSALLGSVHISDNLLLHSRSNLDLILVCLFSRSISIHSFNTVGLSFKHTHVFVLQLLQFIKLIMVLTVHSEKNAKKKSGKDTKNCLIIKLLLGKFPPSNLMRITSGPI